MALGQVLKNLLLYFHPKGVFYQFPSLFRSTWYQSMATNKDRIEKLESEMQKLKESMQKKSQSLGSSMREIKKCCPNPVTKSDSLSIPKSNEQGTLSHTREKSDQSIGFKTTTHNQPQPTKLDFPKS